MASKNGNVISGGSTGSLYYWYAIVEATQTADTATTRTYSVKLKYYTRYAIDVHSNGALSGGVSGSWSGSMTGTNSGTTKTVITKSVTVSKGSSSKNVSFTGYIQNTGGFGNGKSSATLSVTVPAIDYSAPNAPSGCAASRASDSQSKVTWSNGSTSTTRPRSSTKVERQTDSGSWTQIASVGSSTKNYTDNGISANHRYRYRVRAYGSGGYSGYSTSGYIYTTPAKPSTATATKQAATTVMVSYGTATYATGYEIERYYEGSWTALGTSTTGSYTDSSAPAGTVKYRVRSVRDSLKSGYTETNEVTTIVAPNAPTITSKPSTVLEVGSPASLSWSPNHPDGSSQTKAQIGYSLDGGGETTVDVSGAVTSWAFPESVTGSPHKVKARVRTYGLYEDWGAWSSYVEFQLAYAPSVYFTFPATDDAKIAALPIGVTWDAEDPTGIASQTLKLYSDGSEVLSRTFSGDVRDFDITPDVYIPTNGMEYLLTLSVTGGSSLQSSAQRSFVTAYTGPREPNAAIEYDDSLAASILVSQGDLMPENVVTTLEDVTDGAMLPGLEVYGNTRQNHPGLTSISELTLNVGEEYGTPTTSTPIDLQGNFLSSLPDGTRDVLTVDANGECSIEKSCASYSFDGGFTSYAFGPDDLTLFSHTTDYNIDATIGGVGNALCGSFPIWNGDLYSIPDGYMMTSGALNPKSVYIRKDSFSSVSDFNSYAASNPVEVVVRLSEQQTVELGSIDIPELPSPTANVWMSANIEATHSIVYPEAVTYSVSRVSDGKKTSIATGLEDGETAYDPIPPLNTDYFYEVTAYDAAGAPKSSMKPAKVDAGKKAAYNFGVDGQTCVVMPNVTSQSAEDSMGGTSYDFATGDISLPVFYPSGNVEASRSMGHSCEYPKAKELRQTVRQNPVGWVRDPLGEVTYCRLTYSDSLKTGKPVMADVTVKCEENEWTEPSY